MIVVLVQSGIPSVFASHAFSLVHLLHDGVLFWSLYVPSTLAVQNELPHDFYPLFQGSTK